MGMQKVGFHIGWLQLLIPCYKMTREKEVLVIEDLYISGRYTWYVTSTTRHGCIFCFKNPYLSIALFRKSLSFLKVLKAIDQSTSTN